MSKNIQALLLEINSNLFERADVTRGIMLGLLTRKHVFLVGPPGTAKSATVDAVRTRVTGARRFKTLMTRFSSLEELCGPVSLTALKQDKFKRVITGYLPDAHIAFLDEVFKSNSACLNALLTILNEREYYNGDEVIKVPLVSCVGASNELPQGEDLGALYDRFLLRYYVPSIQEESNFAAMLALADVGAPAVTISLKELEEAQREVQAVKLDEEVLQAVVGLRASLEEKQGITASDRRWRSSMSVLKAEAFLDGRSSVDQGDLAALANVLWSDPAARSKVAQAVVGYATPELAKAVELLDMATEQSKLASSLGKDVKKWEHVEKFKTIDEEFKGLLRGRNVSGKLAAIRDQFEAVRKSVKRTALG